jgi:hypothetical protein
MELKSFDILEKRINDFLELKRLTKKNAKGIAHANSLIASGDVMRPETWKRPTAEMENAYIEENGYDKYALWFLGVDPELDKDTKGHYGYIYTSDFKTVDRRGLSAIRQYSAQNNMTAIYAAAGKMIEAIDGKE